MIDAATSDEDKVTPVYKLEEICEVLRSSHVSIVKEFSEFILKRLEHKSPVVKQKVFISFIYLFACSVLILLISILYLVSWMCYPELCFLLVKLGFLFFDSSVVFRGKLKFLGCVASYSAKCLAFMPSRDRFGSEF